MKATSVELATTLLCAVLQSACSVTTTAAGPATTTQAGGSQAIAFELPTLSGGSIDLRQRLGHAVIVLEFWATYCEPCLQALPELDTLYREYRAQGLVALAISIDGPDSVAQVRAQVAKLGLLMPVLLDQDTRVLSLYSAQPSPPFRVLIDRAGRVRETHEGYRPGELAPFEAQVRAALSR